MNGSTINSEFMGVLKRETCAKHNFKQNQTIYNQYIYIYIYINILNIFQKHLEQQAYLTVNQDKLNSLPLSVKRRPAIEAHIFSYIFHFKIFDYRHSLQY